MTYYRYWWGNSKDELSPRMTAEVLAMKTQFGKGKCFIVPAVESISDCAVEVEVLDLKLNMDNPNWVYWIVTFRMYNQGPSRINTNERWVIHINYPPSYPNNTGGALVTVESRNVNDAPHKFYLNDDRNKWYICLEGHDGRQSGWDPGKSTAVTVGLWTIQWLRVYLHWKRTDDWPDYV